jgi:hypothetical protein
MRDSVAGISFLLLSAYIRWSLLPRNRLVDNNPSLVTFKCEWSRLANFAALIFS